MKNKVAILGGTFNPVHIGHVWIAQQLIDEHEMGSVWLMPCYDPHWKACNIEEKHRYRMLMEAAQPYTNVEVSTIELYNKFSFTYQTVEYLCEKVKDIDFYFVLGEDWDRTQFKNYTDMKDKIEFLTIGEDIDFSINTTLRSTMIRNRIRLGQNITGLVHPSVRKYIYQHKLYLGDQNG